MGLFSDFKNKVLAAANQKNEEDEAGRSVGNLIALGVLLWEVAEADEKFLPEEKAQIEDSKISNEDMPIVLRSIEEASIEKIDLYTFTKAVSQDLKHKDKLNILESLFRVACGDGELDEKEHEVIRKISGLFQLDHQDFIDTKIKVKKEFGLKTI